MCRPWPWLTRSPAALWLQAGCQPTCTQQLTCSLQEGPQRASLPLSPAFCQPVGEPAVPSGSGPPSLPVSARAQSRQRTDTVSPLGTQ